jgi:hypothetical protein
MCCLRLYAEGSNMVFARNTWPVGSDTSYIKQLVRKLYAFRYETTFVSIAVFWGKQKIITRPMNTLL